MSVRIDEILKLIILFKLFLDDEIIKLGEDDRDVLWDVSKPGDLTLGSFDISVRNKDSFKSSLNLGKLDDTWKIIRRKSWLD